MIELGKQGQELTLKFPRWKTPQNVNVQHQGRLGGKKNPFLLWPKHCISAKSLCFLRGVSERGYRAQSKASSFQTGVTLQAKKCKYLP